MHHREGGGRFRQVEEYVVSVRAASNGNGLDAVEGMTWA
jgi:hypothetical protein